ncbi:hypothetical protein GKR56_17645 [Providencia alcalifaciens]|nr:MULTISPECIES: hypothetical protein [Providencia]MTB67749.1 hypothetical protein [Providencia sp. wls1943]EKT66513.1 hypothetical protein OO9_08142 [Providencia alcalifaciens Dmel2]ETT03943.1 hypothetical protein HMPREF1562_3645 [Providencia alcalifaciens F90-2004]EUC95100.1 hypothetical protein HMPREF1567_1502 [Providencia alcalifaciens PAL-2]EUD03713.1 hypothetical protein HMPREF1565_1256 [Providencia alcalifaciens RIMD 1656011]
MKKRLFSKLFIVIALLTSASVLAQTLDMSGGYQSTKIEYLLKKNKIQDNGDIESMREDTENNSISLIEKNLDRRFNNRQFRINHK